jgi:hypothetical protein
MTANTAGVIDYLGPLRVMGWGRLEHENPRFGSVASANYIMLLTKAAPHKKLTIGFDDRFSLGFPWRLTNALYHFFCRSHFFCCSRFDSL